MSMPLISIVIPNYNYARFLPQAVRSAAEQEYPNTELVVVDDCSCDDSMQVLEDLREKYPDAFPGGFCVERNRENMGAHAALNRGIGLAKGRFAALMNADDLYQKNRLRVMYDALSEMGARLAFSGVRCIGPQGEPASGEFAEKMRSLPQTVSGVRFAALAAVAENVAVSTGNMLVETAFHRELGGFRDYRYVHDYDFLFRACLASEPAYVPETDYLYRLHGDNTFMKLADIGIAENRLVWLEMYAAVKRGDVKNEKILAEPDYVQLFREAARAYGFQKKVMWQIAGTPAGAAVAAAMRKKLKKAT